MNSYAVAAAAATSGVLISTMPLLAKDVIKYSDQIVTTNKAILTAPYGYGRVELTVNGVKLPPFFEKNTPWRITVQLNSGVNLIKGTASRKSSGKTVDGEILEFVEEFKSDLMGRGTQEVFLDWSDAGTDDILKDIARLSLRRLSAASLITLQSKSNLESAIS